MHANIVLQGPKQSRNQSTSHSRSLAMCILYSCKYKIMHSDFLDVPPLSTQTTFTSLEPRRELRCLVDSCQCVSHRAPGLINTVRCAGFFFTAAVAAAGFFFTAAVAPFAAAVFSSRLP